MKKYKIFLGNLFGLILLSGISFGQSPPSPNDGYLKIDSLNQTYVYVQLEDTASVSEIQIQVGSSSILADIFDNSFLFDQGSGLPINTSYVRNGNLVVIGTGIFQEFPIYYTRIRLKNLNNQWSDWFSFISN